MNDWCCAYTDVTVSPPITSPTAIAFCVDPAFQKNAPPSSWPSEWSSSESSWKGGKKPGASEPVMYATRSLSLTVIISEASPLTSLWRRISEMFPEAPFQK